MSTAELNADQDKRRGKPFDVFSDVLQRDSERVPEQFIMAWLPPTPFSESASHAGGGQKNGQKIVLP